MTTRPCPNCGNLVPEQARFCGQCGQTIAAESAPPARPGAAQTLLDSKPFGATPESQVPTKKAAALGQTLADPGVEARARDVRDEILGSASTEPKEKPLPDAKGALGRTMLLGGTAPPAGTPPDPKAALQTMLGMPAIDMSRAPSRQDAPPQAAPQGQAQAHPQDLKPALKTMLGVAIPGIAPIAPGQPAASAPSGAMAMKPHQGTMLGVAVPGIAPLHAGQAAPAPMQHAAPPPPIVPAPAPLYEEPLPEAPRMQQKQGISAVAVVAVLFAVVALVGLGAYFLIRSGPPLSAQPQLDEAGHESLKVGCPTCPDGTTIALGASSASMQGGAAVLPLPAPLSIGDNDLTVKLDRPGAGRDEDVKIHVPVAYRVRADLATLGAKPPAITVRVEATAGSTVEVDGKPVALDAGGRASYAIDLSKDTEGPSDEQKTFDKKIPFSITPKGGTVEKGTLTARAAIVPLHLDAPGLSLVTDKTSAPVTGQTRPGATLTIDGQAATVDEKGRFGVRVELPQIGEKILEIVTSAPPLAPRVVHARVVRTTSLEASARELAAESPLAYDVFGADPASKVGQKAVVEGEVLEARVAQGHTVLLVAEKKACAKGVQCLVRVAHGDEDKLARGDVVRAYGRLVGVVASSGKNVPDVDASLVLTVKGTGK